MSKSDFQDAYDEGYEACMRGQSRKKNPYPKGSDQHEDWDNGWNECNNLDMSQEE